MKKRTTDVVVIGAGAGGLSTAALLANQGYKVTVVEKNEGPGGRGSVLKSHGFTFDMGPSWYLMPDVFERFFAAFGKKPEEYLDLVKLDPQYRIFFGDGSKVDMPVGIKKIRALFEKIEPGSGPQFDAFMAESKLKYEVAIQSFLYTNMDSVVDMAQPAVMKHPHKLHLWYSMQQYVQKYFTSPKLQQIVQYSLAFLGGSPHNMPALFTLLAHMDFNLGVYYPMGGMAKLFEAMADVADDYGVEFIYNQPVTKIVTNAGVVSQVITEKYQIECKAVVASAEMPHVDSLFDDTQYQLKTKKQWGKKVWSPSAFLMYLGVEGSLPQLKHHTLYMGKDWDHHFVDIFDAPKWPVEPSLYINKPSATDPSVAPKGHENLMVLVPIASGLDDSKLWQEQYGNYIIQFIEERTGVKLANRIVFRRNFSITDFTDRYNSFQGNALGGLAHTLFQSAVWRPNNFHPKLENMFYAGATTVPGIGVPPAVISGHLALERVQNYLR